jgi:hypothetical protein
MSDLTKYVRARAARDSEFADDLEAGYAAATWEAEEQATAEAYARHPDSPDAAFDPTVWEGRNGNNQEPGF